MNEGKIRRTELYSLLFVEISAIVFFLILSAKWSDDWTGFLPLLGVAVMSWEMYKAIRTYRKPPRSS